MFPEEPDSSEPATGLACEVSAEVGKTSVWAVAGDVPQGTTVSDAIAGSLLECRLIPDEFLSEHAVLDFEGREAWEATTDLLPGQVAVDGMFVEPG